MSAVFYLLLLIGFLGAFDVAYFHTYQFKLNARPECQKEVFWHTVRHLIYGLQFIAVANLRFYGPALLILALIFAADFFVAMSDVLSETSSRKLLGGLPRGEYFMHILLSVLVGIYLALYFIAVLPDWNFSGDILITGPDVPVILRLLMSVMGLTALALFVYDAKHWLDFRKRFVS